MKSKKLKLNKKDISNLKNKKFSPDTYTCYKHDETIYIECQEEQEMMNYDNDYNWAYNDMDID